MKSEVHHIDCLSHMKQLPDKCFTLSIADPPYGIRDAGGATGGAGKLRGRAFNNGKIDRWDKAPGEDFFQELFRISKNVIIWGGNYFHLPPTRCFVCWDKVQPWPNFSQVEYAWTSFTYPSKLFRFDNRTGEKIHPTQKPVELYAYLLQQFAPTGGVIYDPMMGSQSSRIAAHKLGYDYIGCEIDDQYFTEGCERFEKECLGVVERNKEKKLVQLSLF
jgi:site-specific DNA-methyltransferase (adenine-specific)